MNPGSLQGLLDLLVARGGAQYGGEPVTQLAHALQTATLAEQAGEPAELIAAALLHDLGHFTDGADVERAGQGIDDRHERRALPLLMRWFGPGVVEPVRLHVEAKRYLCTVEPRYMDELSAASLGSLALQGGVFRPEEAEAFIRQPHAGAAVRLRRYDDLAKDPRRATPGPAHFLRYLQAAARS
ncbi:HD domain-containing protein [Solimonas sp. K1W22B-7]|uniref:HD domain-containing protein n=1 Tax=Solimonas sp. K1W22B-7 TaxID=2303331 RepID=UPI000E336CB4|nr:HD domain-containing protein [Solimonas sp. K1W22B-7]AXQ28925.1 HD domain-containing protein [Solimonas sp. K1W22B-7]